MNGFLELVHDERLDQSETLAFVVPVEAPKAELLVEDTEFRWRERVFIVRQVEADRNGSQAVLRVEADALWYRLGEDTLVGSTFQPTADDGAATGIPERETVRGGLAIILAGSGWTVDTDRTPDSADRFLMEEQDLSRLALLRRWASITGRHLRWDTQARTVALTEDQGATPPVSFRYGRNLERILRRSQAPVATVLHAYGRDDLTVAGVNGGVPFVEDFSYYTGQGLTLAEARARFTKRRVWRDDRYLIDTNLLASAQRRLAQWSQPQVSYECKVVDLAELIGTPEAAALQVGDTVRVADRVLGLDLRTVVVRLVVYPLEPWRNGIELSTLPERPGDTSSSAGGLASMSWAMFKSDNAAEYRLRNDGSYLTNRLGLRFREGGEAVYGYDVNVVGVGTGSLGVSAFDAETGELLHRPLELPYTDGEVVHETMTWAKKGLAGQQDVRVRMVTTADGGPQPSAGADVAEAESRLWVLAYGAVQQTPTEPNSAVFNFTGAVQPFTVPDNVFEIRVEALGGAGGGTKGGRGGRVAATFQVTPGQVLDVYVGGQGNYPGGAAGWPNGGAVLDTTLLAQGGTGGGSSDVRPEGAALSSSLLVAGAGGGSNRTGVSRPQADAQGGAGGFFGGADGWGLNPAGTPGVARCGLGATQFAGGASPWGGTAGTFGQGGNSGPTSNSFHFAAGAGGGGWYGGGGGGTPVLFGGGSFAGDGGGGSGHITEDVPYHDLEVADGFRAGHGQVTISWDNPL